MKLKFPFMNAAGDGGAGGAAPPTPGAPGAAGNTGTPPAWHTVGFDTETQGWIQNRGLDKLTPDKALPEVIKGYRGAEKLIGVPADRVLKLPGDTDAPESWNPVYDRLGRPADPKGYDIPLPEGSDRSFSDSLRPVFHELGLNTKQVKGLTEKYNAAVDAARADQVKEYEVRATADAKALKTEWGAAHEKNMSIAKGVAKTFGMTGDVIDALESAMGYAGVMRFLNKVGASMGEDKFHSGGASNPGFNGAMTPAAAQNRITALRADPDFVKKYLAGGAKEKEEMNRLHTMAYPADSG